jgi:protein-tyrosine phosphatase
LIDLHCHVVPGIDDGPADEGQTRELLAALAADGIEVVAATHHFREDYPAVTAEAVRTKAEAVNALGVQNAPEVIPAGEVALEWVLSAASEALAGPTYGQRGTDMLLETPSGPLPPQFHDVLFRLKARGLRVLLAHPERNRSFQEAPRRLAELVREGVLLQINASSLLSTKPGSRSRALALALLDEGIAHIIATDAHSAHWRPPALRAAVALAEERIGPRARWMVTSAPEAVLAGTALPPAPPPGYGGGRFRRRRRRFRG